MLRTEIDVPRLYVNASVFVKEKVQEHLNAGRVERLCIMVQRHGRVGGGLTVNR